MKQIICLAGQGGVGKDHVADRIKNNLSGSIKISLADPIKVILAEAGLKVELLWGNSKERNRKLSKKEIHNFWLNLPYGDSYNILMNHEINHKKDLTIRDLLQCLGEGHRGLNPSIWIDKCFEDCLIVWKAA